MSLRHLRLATRKTRGPGASGGKGDRNSLYAAAEVIQDKGRKMIEIRSGLGSAQRACMKGKTMKAFSFSLIVLYLFGVANFAAGFAAEGLGLPQTQSGGGVTVKVTYLAQTEHESKFSVVLDTHSVNLDVYDFKALSLMRDDTGLAMQPTGAESKGSGHHREVVLTFPRPSLGRKWLELVIKDIAGVKERTFRWDRK